MIVATAATAAAAYAKRGWLPIPVFGPAQQCRNPGKQPVGKSWQSQARPTPEDIPRLFPEGRNVGLLLGSPSGGLVDVDLDCAEALFLADEILPPTGMVHGRASTPSSHRWYTVEGESHIQKYVGDKGTLVELRGTGGQTVLPPSVHPSGEACTWRGKGDPAHVPYRQLQHAVAQLAAACDLVQSGWEPPAAVEWVKFPDVTQDVGDRVREWLGIAKPKPSRTTTPTITSSDVFAAAGCEQVLSMLGVSDVAERMNCPLRDHENSDDSFTIGPKPDVWYCHSCSTGGNPIHLVQALRGGSYVEARAWIAEGVGIAPAQGVINPVKGGVAREVTRPAIDVVTLADLGRLAVENHQRAANGDLGKRIYTGLRDVDSMLRGLRPGQLTLLGARPSVGKTSLLLRMLLGAARGGFHAAMVSLEISEDELATSMTAIQGGVWRSHVEDGKLPPEVVERIAGELAAISGTVRFMCPPRTPTTGTLIGACHELHAEWPLDLVAIDYIQRVATSTSESKVQALEALSLAVCEFARGTGCHVLATAQLNRESEHRGKNAPPRMADLKGSGQFEQDAHNVLLLHRPNKDSESTEKPDDRAWLLVAKQRNGPTGTIRLAWNPLGVSFSDWRGPR